MDGRAKTARRLKPLWRAVVEIGSIIFLFYSNLLMGEFSGSNGQGKTLVFALRDMITGRNLVIGFISAVLGYFIFEYLRKKV